MGDQAPANDVMDFLRRMEATSQSVESLEMVLRLRVASLVAESLESRGKTQKWLADRAELQPSRISEIMHADENLTLETIARVLYALDIRDVSIVPWDIGDDTQSPAQIHAGVRPPYRHSTNTIKMKGLYLGKAFKGQNPWQGSISRIRGVYQHPGDLG